jgi:hypothetical protein
MRTDEHDVAECDGLRDLEDAALLDAGLAFRSARDLARLGMPLGDVEAFDDDGCTAQRCTVLPAGTEARRRARPALLVTKDPLDDTTLAGILALEYHDLITGAKVRNAGVTAGLGSRCHHSTSGASEMIFM